MDQSRLQNVSTSFIHQLIRLPPRQKGYVEFPKLLAKVWPEVGMGSKKWRVSAYPGIVNGVTHNLASKFLPGMPCDISSEVEEKLYSDRCLPSEQKVNNTVILLDKLKAIQLHLLASEHWNTSYLKSCNRYYLPSAINLTHYLALRSLDLRQFKDDLSSVGLVDVESVNSHILASISAAIQLLESLVLNATRSKENIALLAGLDHVSAQECEWRKCHDISMTRKMALSRAETLFGPFAHKNCPHIMVTVGREAIANNMLIPDIIKAGADVIRINCAHDDPSVWDEIIRNAKESSKMLGKPCRILMDLAGPKLRTCFYTRDENVIRVSPKKDAHGNIILPAQLWLCCAEDTLPTFLSPDATIYVDQEFFHNLRVDDVLSFTDFRGRERSFKVFLEYRHSSGSGYMVECSRTAYIGLGMKFYIKKKNKKLSVGVVVKMPAVEQFRILKAGDLLTLSKNSCLSVHRPSSSAVGLTRLTCSSDHLIDSVKPGEPIAFDDGKIWGTVQKKCINEITVLITNASPEGSRLGSKKSINIPNSEMQPKGLTSKDLVNLEFIAAHADIVGISFVRDASDIVNLQHELEKRRLQRIGVVLKIETRDAFEKLPELLFQAMQLSNPIGVMVARGDLMVECGWDRLADIQEEMVSICNAAHIPVIWATQVLESLVKFGYPTRAEITDIVVAMKTSCIMLNKGEFIVEAVSALNSIFSNHSRKGDKTTLLTPLSQSYDLRE